MKKKENVFLSTFILYLFERCEALSHHKDISIDRSSLRVPEPYPNKFLHFYKPLVSRDQFLRSGILNNHHSNGIHKHPGEFMREQKLIEGERKKVEI